MNYYYYSYPSSTSLSKKLIMALTTMLLIFAIAVAQDGQSSCNYTMPVAAGPCIKIYRTCVDRVITNLLDHASSGLNFYTSYPPDYPSGGVTGLATCVSHVNDVGYISCLNGALSWLVNNCDTYSGGYYSDGGDCTMFYAQIPMPAEE
ncbi:hypothetical protein LINPERPRIM_LOCUS23475 [Linum perenne]